MRWENLCLHSGNLLSRLFTKQLDVSLELSNLLHFVQMIILEVQIQRPYLLSVGRSLHELTWLGVGNN